MSKNIDRGTAFGHRQAWRSWLQLAAGVILLGFTTTKAATIVVTNLANMGPGTLRQALVDNELLGGGNVITFATNLSGTIVLQGELPVAAQVNIEGPGASVLSVSGDNVGRVFLVTAGPTTISDLTIRNGRVVGNDAAASFNGGNAYGGGIHNNNILVLSNCVVISNTVVGGAGGKNSQGVVGHGGYVYGGGVHNQAGSLTLLNTRVQGNVIQGGVGGGGSNVGAGGNAYGGGVASVAGSLQVFDSDFVSNAAVGGNGGSPNGGGTTGAGGNAAGGNLYNSGVVNATAVTFRNGSAAGAASTGIPGASFGGGIASVATITLTSCTVVSNNASGSTTNSSGGGIGATGDLGVFHSTVAFNQAYQGGGINGNFVAGSTIVAGNAATMNADVNGMLNSLDYNLIQATNGLTALGPTVRSVFGLSPQLGPLQNNGGPNPTLSPLPGSPAIDRANNFGVATDQRGAPRPFDFSSITNAVGGDGSDIGAVELGRPTLRLERSGNAAVLKWPTYYAGFSAEASTNLTLTNGWISVPGVPTTVLNEYVLTNAPLSGAKYFRLKYNLP